jgi:DNA polymerase-1
MTSKARMTTTQIFSSAPNLQNAAVHSEHGKDIREAFIPAPGSTVFSVDYSPLELRMITFINKNMDKEV